MSDLRAAAEEAKANHRGESPDRILALLSDNERQVARITELEAVVRRIPEWFQQQHNGAAQCVLCTGYRHEGHYGDCHFAAIAPGTGEGES